MARIPKEWRRLVKAAEDAGWRIRAARGHAAYVLYPEDPEQRAISISGTPKSNARSFENTVAQLRRAGLDV